jgi:hypothetical protein
LATTSSTDFASRTPPLASGESSLNLPLKHRHAVGDRCAVGLEELLALIFVDVHV